MVTLRDISAECGISVAAVSKALNDHSDISEKTKERVREVAEMMGYRIRRKENRKVRSFRIGVLVTEEAETFFHLEIIMELRKCLMEKGFDMVMLSPHITGGGKGENGVNPERPGYVSRAKSLGLEGIFLFTRALDRDLYEGDGMKSLRELIVGEIPLIAVDCLFGPCSCILPEYGKAVEGLVDHLFEMGHARVAFVCREEDGEGIYERAYRDALRNHQVEVPPSYLCRVRGKGIKEAREATARLLRSGRWILPTSIIFADDLLLAGGMTEIRRSGLKVPSNLSVAAVMLSGERNPHGLSVTSWHFSPERIAREAVLQMRYEISARSSSSCRRMKMEPGVLCEGETAARINIG